MNPARADCLEVLLKWLAVLLAILFWVAAYWLITEAPALLQALVARLAL